MIKDYSLLYVTDRNHKHVHFTITGDPVGKQRPLVVKRGNFARGIKRTKTRLYENKAREIWNHSYDGERDITNEAKIDLEIYYPIPKSWPKWKKEAARRQILRPSIKGKNAPDADNVLKMIMDTLNPMKVGHKNVPNTGLYKDDGQIVDGSFTCWYSDNPRVEVDVVFQPKLDLVRVKLLMQKEMKKSRKSTVK